MIKGYDQDNLQKKGFILLILTERESSKWQGKGYLQTWQTEQDAESSHPLVLFFACLYVGVPHVY